MKDWKQKAFSKILEDEKNKQDNKFDMIETFEKLINEIEGIKVNGIFTRLEIYYNMRDYDSFQELTKENKAKIIGFIYSYWIDNDFYEYNLLNVCDMVIDSAHYCEYNILQLIDSLSYEEFEKIINEC